MIKNLHQSLKKMINLLNSKKKRKLRMKRNLKRIRRVLARKESLVQRMKEQSGRNSFLIRIKILSLKDS